MVYIRDAKWNFVDGSIAVHGLDGSTLGTIPQSVLVTAKKAKEAARTITIMAKWASRGSSVSVASAVR
jgi:hypothetical protein